MRNEKCTKRNEAKHVRARARISVTGNFNFYIHFDFHFSVLVHATYLHKMLMQHLRAAYIMDRKHGDLNMHYGHGH